MKCSGTRSPEGAEAQRDREAHGQEKSHYEVDHHFPVEVHHDGVENKHDDGVSDFQLLRGLRIENQYPENVKQGLQTNPNKLPEDVTKQLRFHRGDKSVSIGSPS